MDYVAGLAVACAAGRLPSMPSLRQSNPRALPSHVRRSRRIPAKPPSHISSRSKEVLSPIPRCDSTGRQLIPLAPAHGRTEEMLLRRAGGCLLASAHFSLSHLESGQGVSPILKLRSVFGNTHLSCGAVSVSTELFSNESRCDYEGSDCGR